MRSFLSVTLFVLGSFALLVSFRLMAALRKERIDTPSDSSVFEGDNDLYRVNLFRAEGFTPSGQALLRRYFLAVGCWFLAWLAAFFAMVAG